MSDVDQSMSDGLEPLFLELGKAVFICQSLEESLCFLHAQLSHEEADRDEGAFEASWDFHSGKALGKLINALRKRIERPEEVDEFLNSGRVIRNEIVHGFMTKNIHRLSDPKDRLVVEAELVCLKLEVKKRDVMVNKRLDALFAKYGFSNAEPVQASMPMVHGGSDATGADLHCYSSCYGNLVVHHRRTPPNPSIEGMPKRLRLLGTPHVKR